MHKDLKKPPSDKNDISSPEELVSTLEKLIGTEFELSGKSRTDGSKIRKLIGNTLYDAKITPEPAVEGTYEIIPPKKKGVPKILLENVDSYIVTSGDSYNLQVWNRNPATDSVQVEYSNGDVLSADEVRFIFTKISINENLIESIVVLTPDYIEEHFGKFGKPTIKQQLIISGITREKISKQEPPILFYSDSDDIKENLTDEYPSDTDNIHDNPTNDKVLKLEFIYEIVRDKLIGVKLDDMATKNRGQNLELLIAKLLGYTEKKSSVLAGGYPDIRNQMLEIKVQDSPTVDLGRYSPQFEEEILNNFTTSSMRYLIALTNPKTGIVEGAVLCPGKDLGKHFTYISDSSFKSQRSIPMIFFDKYKNQAVYNPVINYDY
ncbi:nuclease [Dolosigranulum pigrum]|uniref:nuclease n=1 Tax=Dolosigranulum pigrum TaxID=29394 RepID=UPI000DBFD997|nr:nuclease [Dolosigranulum pigrum]RAN55761.1 nuclease [Dolosigranulum pigrum]